MEVNRIKSFFFPDPQSKRYVTLTYITISLLALLAVGVTFVWFQVPDIIPIHFSLGGKPDVYGSKKHLWELMLVPFIIFIVISAILQSNLIKKTFRHTYPDGSPNERSYTEESKLTLYILRVGVVLIFCAVTATAYFQSI
ncbi:MAG: DUF1648 domain-containing protein [Chitinophaga sp.]|uniref:DUF1648 domain-containing protein n=1 Tax=Chitinophaga sp. TaxID=1869181 RepID=UPI0025B7AE16|nr:DUF1648 domain-containing protein [Chitinophaga sp.]MBV8251962.1 DUF1648 domain-containing protein [Chitinophaga sp.]